MPTIEHKSIGLCAVHNKSESGILVLRGLQVVALASGKRTSDKEVLQNISTIAIRADEHRYRIPALEKRIVNAFGVFVLRLLASGTRSVA